MGVHFYRLREDTTAGYTGDISAASKWGLPGVRCPKCGNTWSTSGTAYPCVDLSQHPHRAEFEVPRPEPIEEFERLRELVRPDALHRFLLGDQSLFHHINGNFDRGDAGPFADTCLQHVELALLDGDFLI